MTVPNLALRWGIEEGMTLLGLQGTLDDAEVEIGKGLIRIRGFQSTESHTPVDLGSLDLRFRWKPLLNRQLSLERLALTGLDLTAEYRDDGALIISGVPLPASGGDDTTASPWGLDASSVILTDSRVVIHRGPHAVVMDIDSLRLAGLNSRRPDQVSAWRFVGRINGQSFDIHGNGTPLADIPNYALRISGKEIDLQAFEALLQAFGMQRMRGKATLDLSLNGDIRSLPQIGGTADISQADMSTPDQTVTAERLLWQGQFSALSALRNDGSFHAHNLNVHYGSGPDMPNSLSAKEILWNGQIVQDDGANADISIVGALGVQDLDLNHQDSHLDAQAFSWQGTIKLTDTVTVSGDLRGQGLNARQQDPNNPQDQRALTAARAGWSGQIHWNTGSATLALNGEGQLDDTAIHSAPYTLAAGRLHVRGQLQQDDALSFQGQAAVHTLQASRPGLAATLNNLQITVPQLVLKADGNLESAAQIQATALNVDAYGMAVQAKEVSIVADSLNYTEGSDHLDWIGSLQVLGQSAKSGTLSLSHKQMGWTGTMTVYLTPKGRELQKGKGTYIGQDIHLQAGNFDIQVKESRADGTFSRKIPRSDTESPLGLNLTTDAKDLWVRERKRDWLHAERIKTKKLELRPGTGLFFQDVVLNKPKLLARHLGKRGLSYPWRLEADKAGISDFDITYRDGFRIGNVTLSSATARVTRGSLGRGEQGILGLEMFRPRPSSTAATAEKPSSATKKNKEDEDETVRLSIRRLALDGDSRIEFVDQTTSSGMVRVNLREVQASLTDLTNIDPDKSLGFQIDARMGSGYLSAKGRTTPFLTPPDFEINASLRAYNLIALSPYLADALGVHLHTGQLNATLFLSAMTGILNGRADLNLRRLEIDPPDPNAPLVKSADLPVESIISWLKDSRGNIHLSIPISGDLYNPDFDLDRTVSAAIGGAIRDTLSGTLRVVAFPLAVLVSFFEHLGEEPPFMQIVRFPAGDTALDEAAKAQLVDVANAARTRPEDPLIICSFAQAEVDWPPLFAATQTKPMEPWLERALLARPGDAPPLSADTPDDSLLQTLADRRSLAANIELINTHKIDSDRRIACRSHIDQLGPRIEIGF